MFEKLGANVGVEATRNLTEALPGVEKTITDAVSGLQVLVTQTIVPIVAEIVTEALSQIDRMDGATMTLEPSGKLTATVTVAVDIPTFTARVSMPLKLQN